MKFKRYWWVFAALGIAALYFYLSSTASQLPPASGSSS